MRRGLRKLIGGGSDKNVVEAAATAANSATDASLDNTAFGLNTWVEGVNPVVE